MNSEPARAGLHNGADDRAEAEDDVQLSRYDFDYPESLIAQRPSEPRDAARLLLLDRRRGAIEHAIFRDLPRWLEAGDCLVANRSRVIPARLVGRKATGGKVELLVVREQAPGLWSVLASGVKPGTRLQLPGGWSAQLEQGAGGEWNCRFSERDVRAYLERHGQAPLPPYILRRRREDGSPGVAERDAEAYQTVYAREHGSIAAPTAGLHFTADLLRALRERAVRWAELVLHVGPGTFRPVSAEDIRQHRMLPEWYRLEPEAIETIGAARAEGRRVVAVGTTAARALETWAATGEAEGTSSLFIAPGHSFRAFDAFLTNFHLPRSTPLVLAAAFSGRERLLAAYREAIERGYRLYSYGDAMLIR